MISAAPTATRPAFQRSVPDDMRALDTFTQPDYADLFTVPIAAPQAHEAPARWARHAVEDAPPRIRLIAATAVVLQRLLLGMRGDPRTRSRRLGGWHIAAHGDRWVRIEASGRLMSGHIVLRLDADRLNAATFVRYHRRAAALIWPPISRIHRRVGLVLMRHAARSAEDMQP